MRSKDELTTLFETYFGHKLSSSEIDRLVVDVTTGIQYRKGRTYAATPGLVASVRAAQPEWSSEDS
jgi:hypothetical protein